MTLLLHTRNRVQRYHRVYGIGVAFVYLFMLAPLLVILGRQAEKERLRQIEYADARDWFNDFLRRVDVTTIEHRQPVRTALLLTIECSKDGTIHWSENGVLRHTFLPNQRERFEQFHNRMMRNYAADTTKVLLANVRIHPDAAFDHVAAILSTHYGPYCFLSRSDAPSPVTEQIVRLAERELPEDHSSATELGMHCIRIVIIETSPPPLDNWYHSVFAYFGFASVSTIFD